MSKAKPSTMNRQDVRKLAAEQFDRCVKRLRATCTDEGLVDVDLQARKQTHRKLIAAAQSARDVWETYRRQLDAWGLELEDSNTVDLTYARKKELEAEHEPQRRKVIAVRDRIMLRIATGAATPIEVHNALELAFKLSTAHQSAGKGTRVRL